jgi:ribonuclease-3
VNVSEKEQWWRLALASFQERLGYSFVNIATLEEALTHASFAHEAGLPFFNERLEFLGDAVLELVVSAGLFNEYTHEDEGVLTRYRANLVCKDALSAWGTSMEIPRLVRLGKGLVHQGANASIIADASEAVFGAVFFDGGYEAASQVILRYLFFQSKSNAYDEKQDPKSLLQEETQKRGLGQPQYKVVSSEGPSHMPLFTVQLSIGDHFKAVGRGHSIKMAESKVAQQVLTQTELWCKNDIDGGP